MDYSKKIFNLLSEAGSAKSGITDAQTKKIFYDNGGITDKKLRELQEKKRRELELRSRLLDQDPIINKKINLHLENQNQEPSSDNYNYGFVQPSEEGLFGLAGFGSNKFGIEGTIGGYVPYDFATNPYFKGNYFANAQKHFPKLSVGVGANKEIFGYPDQSGNFTRVASGISPNFNLKFNFQEGGQQEESEIPYALLASTFWPTVMTPFISPQETINHLFQKEDSTLEDFLEIVDPAGELSFDDAIRAYQEWQNSGEDLPTFLQTLDMIGVVPELGKFSKIKNIPWQNILNTIGYGDAVNDIYEHFKEENTDSSGSGGWKFGGELPKFQVGGEEKNGEKEKLWNFTEPEYPYAPSTIIDDVEVSESTRPVLNLSQEGKDQMTNEIADWVSAKEDIRQTGLDYSDLAVRVINYPRNWQGSYVRGVGSTGEMDPGHIEAVIINKNTGEIVEGLTPINRWAYTDAKDVNFSALGYEGVRYVDLELDPLQLETFLTEAKKFRETDYSNLSEEQEKFHEEVFKDRGFIYPGSFGTGSPDEYDLFRANCADGVCRGLGIADTDALQTAFGATDPELVFDYIINSGDYKYDTAYGEKGPTNAELVQIKTGLSPHSSQLIADWAEGLTEADLASLEKHAPHIYNKYYKGLVDSYDPAKGFAGLLYAIAASPQGTIPLLSQVLVQEGLIEPVKKHFTEGRVPYLMPGKYREGGDISQMGYRDDSPYRDRDYIDIETKNGLIDMSNTGKTLFAHDEYGNAKVLPPYSGLHKFLGHRVREYNLDKYKF